MNNDQKSLNYTPIVESLSRHQVGVLIYAYNCGEAELCTYTSYVAKANRFPRLKMWLKLVPPGPSLCANQVDMQILQNFRLVEVKKIKKKSKSSIKVGNDRIFLFHNHIIYKNTDLGNAVCKQHHDNIIAQQSVYYQNAAKDLH